MRKLMPQKAQGKRSEVWAGLRVCIKAAQVLGEAWFGFLTRNNI